jgi:hypothetical protein
MEARRLKTARTEVVLKADADTDLILSIHTDGEAVDVTAKVQCGDFAAIQAHWPHLQQVLAPQQVNLTLLPKPTQKSVPSQPQAAAPAVEDNPAELLEELYCVGSLTEPLRRRGVRHAHAK